VDSKLWEALDLVRSKNMTKRMRDDGQGGHCALGFLDLAHYGEAHYWYDPTWINTDEYLADWNVLGEVMIEMFPERAVPGAMVSTNVASINNHVLTTKEDLELAFEKAAIRRDEILL
jgi:hypothetical protein